MGTDPEEARPEPRLELREEYDEIEMVTEVVEEEPGQVDLKDSSGSEDESSDTPLADSSDAASRSLNDSIAWNADFVAFG